MIAKFLSIAFLTALISTNLHAETCNASWYSAGTRTANGEHFNSNGMTVAHKSLPFGTVMRVSYKDKFIIVRVNDRGPFIAGRCIDLAKGAAAKLGLISVGAARVKFNIVGARSHGP